MYNATFKPSKKLVVFLLFLLAAMLTACGGSKAEPVETQLGIDGYVYMPQQLTGSEGSDFLLSGDHIYFYYNSGIYRADLVSGENGEKEPDFSTKSLLIRAGSSTPEKTENYPRESEKPFINDMRDRILSSGSSRYSFFLTNYFSADTQQNVYYYIQTSLGEEVVYESGAISMDMEPIGGMLYKQTPDGQIAYSLFLPSVNGLAADGEGRLYVLTNEGIHILDDAGNRLDTINIDSYMEEDDGYSMGTLFADPQGKVYYAARRNFSATVLELGGSTPARMKEIPALTGKNISRISAAAGGNLIFSDSRSDMIYEYDRESSKINPLLRWEDVNYPGSSFQNVIRLSPDRLLAEYWGSYDQTLFLLSKTSVDQLPHKEIVVLASLSPTNELREAVIKFNLNSSQYHVIIETYGASLFASGEESRLDATLVSSTPPDLLDLHDIYKYADRDALEDLAPYLEDSDLVPLDDYLESVLDSYTINGKLVCVPTQFAIFLVAGRASQLDAMGLKGGWTMEDVYALTEKYPDCISLHTLTNQGAEDKSLILELFCSTYFLDKYVDLEAGTCAFDSDGFRQLLTWLDEHSGEPVEIPPDPATGAIFLKSVFMPDNALLSMESFDDFMRLVSLEYKFKEEIRLLGMPTADGRNQGYINARNKLGITSNARNKEGAWAFLEYFLSSNKSQGTGSFLPTRKSQLDSLFSAAITPPPINEATGEYWMAGRTRYYYGINESLEYYYTPQRLAQELMTAIETCDFRPRSTRESQIVDIVLEEMESYYSDNKTMEEVTEIIQNRCQLVLDEYQK